MRWQYIHLKEIDSTNNYCKENVTTLSVPAFVYTDYQSKGKGQQNNLWYSESKKNLLCSIVLPIYFQAENNHHISQWVSIVLVSLLKTLSIPDQQIKIKWPNDIIINTQNGYKKIAGILIENIIEKNNIIKSIIGIGLNINQTDFLQLNKTATSLKHITQQTYHIHQVANTLTTTIDTYYPLLHLQKFSSIYYQYIQYLYGWDTEFLFKNMGNQIFKGKITGIHDDGKIRVQTQHETFTFNNKEIQFLL